MLQGLGNLFGQNQNSNPLGTLGTLSALGGLGQQNSNPLGTLGALSALGGLGQQNSNPLGTLGALGGLGGNSSNPLSGLLSGGIKSSQNEQRLMQEKQQRNLLKRYLTQQTGDPIKASLISNTIPGKGALDDFDVGLGTKSNILQSLGLGNQSNLNSVASNPGLLNSLVSNNNSVAGSSNAGLLSSLVDLAKTPNNNGNILNSLGGLGTGLFGNSGNTGSGLLGSIQNGVNTLNTISKVNNAVSSVKGLFA